jgi:FG-GAP repeat protein
MGDVDGDGILDLIVGSGAGRAPEVVAYAGASIRGKGTFGTELARFQAFEAAARGGVSVAAAQIDGTNSDNIIVGSGPGVPSEVKVYQSQLSSSPGAVPALFSSFKPYGDDRSGVTIATGFVDFSTGRESIVTAPGAGSPTEVKVFAFPLLKPNGKAPEGSAQAAGTDRP